MEGRALITSQHRGKTRFLQWVDTLCAMTDPLAGTLETMEQVYRLDTVVGAQLDVLGALAGVSRRLTFRPVDGRSPVLDDATYRFLIKAGIIQNRWNGKNESIMALWRTVYPDVELELIDNQDMTITVTAHDVKDQFIVELIANGYILPKPEGVEITRIVASQVSQTVDLAVGIRVFVSTVFGTLSEADASA